MQRAPFLEDVHVLTPSNGQLDVDLLPDGRTTLIVRTLHDAGGDIAIAGPRRRALFKQATRVTRVVILRAKPGWTAAILGVAADTLTDRIVPLEEVWGRAGARLSDELVAAPATEVVERIVLALALRAESEPASARIARRASALFEREAIRVHEVAARLGVTTRHLRRAFLESVGVSPKDFARCVRLQRAVRLSRADGVPSEWSRIAVDAGYYDQAHLHADFRALVGVTPGAYRRRMRNAGTAS